MIGVTVCQGADRRDPPGVERLRVAVQLLKANIRPIF
jgi:hypothetical protein